MRVLFTFAGDGGHRDPLLPIAQAAVAAGHTVAVSGRPSMASGAEARGLTYLATGTDAESPTTRIPLSALDLEREDRDLREGFARRIARERAGALLGVCDAWRPDVIVCDETDFGAMVAAERSDLPYASVLVTAAGSFVRPELVAEPLHALRAEQGLPADPELAMLSRFLVLAPFPPSFRDPSAPQPRTSHSIRPLVPEPAPGETAPPWLAGLDEAPTVYVTLGTVFNLESGDLFDRVFAGLGDLPVEVIVTVGRQIDPTELGPLPATVHVERFVPQTLVLPHCDAVLCHGGSGSVMGALTHGLPLVVIPMGADQPGNAARCGALGLGRVLDAMTATPETVRDAVSTVLGEPSYRRAAEGIRDEIAALPGPAHAVVLLERLARERRPLPSS